jgi:hypothetical protein
MRRRKTPNGKGKQLGEVSRENYSGEQLLALHFIHHPETWFTREDLEEHLEEIGRNLRRGTIYNLLCRLRQRGLIEGDGGMPVCHRLLPIRSESHPIAS